MGEDLKQALKAMSLRLEHSKPKCVAVDSFTQLFVYTDASFEPSTCCGGLGAVLVDAESHVLAWFGVALDSETCVSLGAQQKGTIIYELELFAAVLALQLWSFGDGHDLVVHFGDNEDEGVRFSLIKAAASGNFGEFLMEHFLKLEALAGTRTWSARVPTEANLSDFHDVEFTIPGLLIHLMFRWKQYHTCRACLIPVGLRSARCQMGEVRSCYLRVKIDWADPSIDSVELTVKLMKWSNSQNNWISLQFFSKGGSGGTSLPLGLNIAHPRATHFQASVRPCREGHHNFSPPPNQTARSDRATLVWK